MDVCSCLACTERGDENGLGENPATCQGYERCLCSKKLKRSCYKETRLCGDCSSKRDAPRPRLKDPAEVQVQKEQEKEKEKEQEKVNEKEKEQDAVPEGIEPAKGLRGFITPAFASIELQRTFSDLTIDEIEKWLEAEIEAEKSESAELVIPAIPSRYHNRRDEFLGACKKTAVGNNFCPVCFDTIVKPDGVFTTWHICQNIKCQRFTHGFCVNDTTNECLMCSPIAPSAPSALPAQQGQSNAIFNNADIDAIVEQQQQQYGMPPHSRQHSWNCPPFAPNPQQQQPIQYSHNRNARKRENARNLENFSMQNSRLALSEREAERELYQRVICTQSRVIDHLNERHSIERHHEAVQSGIQTLQSRTSQERVWSFSDEPDYYDNYYMDS